MKKKTAVVALGGNAITRPGEEDTIPRQFENTKASLASVVSLLKDGYNLAITHGNGPQVGNAILRVELARGSAPVLPLYICDADTEGGIGFMIEQSLQNAMNQEKIKREVVTVITQVVVDKNDPSIKNPTKYVGQFYTKEEVDKLARERGWAVKKDSNRGWRRVVASPIPVEIVEKETIKKLVHSGTVVIAAGGGGVPVCYDSNGQLEGVDAVIDKDRASAVLARDIEAELLIILTGVEKVSLNYGTLLQRDLEKLTLKETKEYLAQGHFPAGSMGPKIEAAISFLESGGKEVVITSIEKGYQAIKGTAGTHLYPN
jgi:carbamate kinase